MIKSSTLISNEIWLKVWTPPPACLQTFSNSRAEDLTLKLIQIRWFKIVSVFASGSLPSGVHTLSAALQRSHPPCVCVCVCVNNWAAVGFHSEWIDVKSMHLHLPSLTCSVPSTVCSWATLIIHLYYLLNGPQKPSPSALLFITLSNKHFNSVRTLRLQVLFCFENWKSAVDRFN